MHVCVPLHATPPSAPCPPPVSGADDTGTEESDDKCPLSANEAGDKWVGARAAPLRCNNRRWMAWCPPTLPPLPPVLVAGAHPAPPAQEGAKPPAWAPITAGQDTQAMEPWSPCGCPWQRNKAVHTAEAGDSLGGHLPAARTHSCAHTWPAHMPSTCVLALCTCSSYLGTNPPYRSTDICFCAMHGHTSATQIWYTPTNTKSCIPMHLHTCILSTCLHMHGYRTTYTCKQKC